MLSILTVNIGAASRHRAERLLAWLATRPEHVVLLTETSAGSGTAYLLGEFARAGWAVVDTSDDGDRGAALVSRIATAAQPMDLPEVSIPGRVAAAVLDTQPQVCVVAVYVPSRDRSQAKTERKETFIASLLKALAGLPGNLHRHLILGGDYNVIARTHRPLHPGFLPFEFGLLEALAEQGLIDAHDHLWPGAQPYSWTGRTGDGYRYDYLHVGPALVPRLHSCAYLHETREQGLTDHAALTMTLQADGTELPTAALAIPRQIALFQAGASAWRTSES
ncbi:endonuclease/exonuclease/phosphatase family protein [Thermoactinospora rubra]|uniref:endonuclease/exonuclease/phosphatase family protein n=1 Tax=Thermoactinospora rubra TaxID=1088767 RepID=UPI000A122775|nr:endonuclease/exonuclease/phosphatase family protein [Thermoactinospora rubra]